jgi:hypothetical protein
MQASARSPAMPMPEEKKQNISLIIGLSIPVAMILFIAVAINGPRWFNTVEPAKFDFLYTTGQQNPYATYSVENGRLVLREQPGSDDASTAVQYPIHFFVHDVTENSSREIQPEEAMDLRLDGSIRSPDGFSVDAGRRSGWFIFGYGRNYRSRYLVNESYSEKLNLETNAGNYNYYWNFRFLGWVIDDE